MDAHTADAFGYFRFLALIEEKQDVLLLSLGRSVDPVHQPFKGILLYLVATAHHYKTLTFGYEAHHLAENLCPLWLQNWPACHFALARCELPSMKFESHVDAIFFMKMTAKRLHALECGRPLFAVHYQRGIDE